MALARLAGAGRRMDENKYTLLKSVPAIAFDTISRNMPIYGE
jgi:hypothetical protein